jgi:hypothetical protein
VNVDCNACGASLSVPETTRFVTCGKCRARLAIRRSDTAIYTEVLDDPAAHESAEAVAPSAGTPSATATMAAPTGGGESVLRVILGVVLVASDAYWWATDPSHQSRYMRIALLGAGAWLIVSGIWRMMAHARARHHASSSSPRVP